MKYTNIKPIIAALNRIHNGGNTQEHRTSTATCGLIHNYFPKESYICTPEQIQVYTRKRPDYTIEKLDANDNLYIHTYVEVKSLINSDFDKILDQLSDSIVNAVDITDNFSTYAIAMKGTKIAFFVYYNYESLLDEYDIFNYKGFIPLNYEIPFSNFEEINSDTSYNKFNIMGDYLKHLKTGIETNSGKLRDIGVESSPKIKHPYIWDLLNKNHEDNVHNMFMRIASSDPGNDIK